MRGIISIDFTKTSSNELFILGRNIYQAACGSSFACQRFINNFGTMTKIPDQAKLHILNGMAYEIYYDARNRLRNIYKTSYLPSVIKYLEQPEFYASKEFIASHLCKIEDRPIYIPGQNELMYFIVKGQHTDDGYQIYDVIYQGRSVLCNNNGSELIDTADFKAETRCFAFEQSATACVAAPADCVRFQYEDSAISHESILLIPLDGFSFRFETNTEDIEEL